MIIYCSPPDHRGRRKLCCTICGLEFAPTTYPPEQAHHRCIVAPTMGPGDYLANFLYRLGMVATASCECERHKAEMNAWGVAGCREHRDEIVGWLKEAYATVDWPTVLASAGAAIFSGLAFRLSLADPFGSLLDEAVRRAEVAAQRQANHNAPHDSA